MIEFTEYGSYFIKMREYSVLMFRSLLRKNQEWSESLRFSIQCTLVVFTMDVRFLRDLTDLKLWPSSSKQKTASWDLLSQNLDQLEKMFLPSRPLVRFATFYCSYFEVKWRVTEHMLLKYSHYNLTCATIVDDMQSSHSSKLETYKFSSTSVSKFPSRLVTGCSKHSNKGMYTVT